MPKQEQSEREVKLGTSFLNSFVPKRGRILVDHKKGEVVVSAIYIDPLVLKIIFKGAGKKNSKKTISVAGEVILINNFGKGIRFHIYESNNSMSISDSELDDLGHFFNWRGEEIGKLAQGVTDLFNSNFTEEGLRKNGLNKFIGEFMKNGMRDVNVDITRDTAQSIKYR